MSRNPSGGSDGRNENNPKNSNSLIRQKNEEIIEKLKELVDQQSQKLYFKDSEIDSLKKKIAELEEEVRKLKETLTSLQGDRNILLIGEVCRKFQANLYQCVFPGNDISPYYSYRMADLEKDIEKTKSDQEKAEARKLWEQLKQREHPEKFQNLVKEFKQMRHTTVHPNVTHLDVKDVLKAAEEVNEQGGFEFLDRTDFNFEDVKELIKMWARIDGYIKDSKK